MNFGPDVKIDFQAMSARWFDYHLKGEQNGVDKEAPVKIFVMGANKWRDEQEWPLARAQADTVLLPQQRLGELALRRRHAEHRRAGERAARQIPLRSAQSGADVRRPRMLRLRLRGDGPARSDA